jgi:hypothetical protein
MMRPPLGKRTVLPNKDFRHPIPDVTAPCQRTAAIDAYLAASANAWRELCEVVRAAILAMARACQF